MVTFDIRHLQTLDALVEKLGITHFIDDRDEILKAINSHNTTRKKINAHQGKLIHFVSEENAKSLHSLTWPLHLRSDYCITAKDRSDTLR